MTVVRLTSLLLVLELPLNKATRMIRKTAPPTIHTQGWVYHSVVVVVSLVTVVLELELVVSCAITQTDVRANTRIKRIL